MTMENNNPFLQSNPFLDYLEASTEGQFGLFQSAAQPFATERRKREVVSDVFQQARQEFLDEFPIAQRIQQQAGSPYTRALAPPTRFLYGF